MNLHPGARFGDLLIERELGRGAFAVVYLAKDTLLERPVALKVLSVTRLSRSEEERKRLLQEARMVAKLQSAHIVSLYRAHDLGEAGLALEMEYMEGGSVAEALKARGRLSTREALAHVRDLLLALDAAHARGIVHRDVKPENLLMTARGEAKLADFGLGRQLGEASLSTEQGGRILGTPLFMAPEVISGDRATPASDLWSVGVLLYQMLAGRRPFEAATIPALFFAIHHETPPRLGDEHPAAVVGAVERCLQKDPGRRPASAADLLRELEGVPAGPRVAPALVAPSRLAAAPEVEPLVGREDELRQLDAALEAAERAQGGVVVLLGEAGVGKSTLLREMGRRAQGRGFRWVEVPLTPLGGLVRALVDASRRLFAPDPGGSPGDDARLTVRFGAAAPQLRGLLQSGESDRQDRQQTVWAVESLIRGLAAEQPVAWVLEDAQFADADDLRMLGELVRRLAGTRTAVLIAHRSNDPLVSQETQSSSAALGEFLRVPGVRMLEVGPLPASALRRVLALHADGLRIATEVLERIEETAEGNPLLARELFRHLVATHEVERDGDAWAPGPRWRGTELPQRLRELVVARLTLLDEEMRQVLDAAAVDGLVFDAEVVAAVLGVGVLATLRVLQRLHRVHRLVTPLQQGFRFAHALFREVVYAELAPALRTAVHRAVAEQLEQRGLGELDPERVGAQWEGAAEVERARPYLARAAGAAADRQQSRRAVALLERAGLVPAGLTPALALANAETLLRCAHAFAESQRGAEAEAMLRLVRTAAQEAGDRLLELRAAVEDAFLRLYREGPALVDQEGLAAAVRELPPIKARGRASYILGVLAKQHGDLEEAVRHLRAAEGTWRALGIDGAVASALDQLAAVAWRAGDLDAARVQYEEAAATSARAGRRVDAAVSEVNLAEVMADLGRNERTEELLERACETLAMAGARDQEEHARGFLARHWWQTGRSGDAFVTVDRALEGLTRSNNLPACATAHLLHQTMLAGTGLLSAALAQRDEVNRLADRCGDLELRVLVQMTDALLHAQIGDLATAVRRADDALAHVEGVPVRGRRELALLLLESATQMNARPWLVRAESLGAVAAAGRSVDARVIRAMTQGTTALLDPAASPEPLERAAAELLEDLALGHDLLARLAGRFYAAEAARRRDRPEDAAALLKEVVQVADEAERVWWSLGALRRIGRLPGHDADHAERRRRMASLSALLPMASRAAFASTWGGD